MRSDCVEEGVPANEVKGSAAGTERLLRVGEALGPFLGFFGNRSKVGLT